MTIDKWLEGSIYMFAAYLAGVYLLIFYDAFWMKLVIGILMPIGFYFHIKQDFENLKRLSKRGDKK